MKMFLLTTLLLLTLAMSACSSPASSNQAGTSQESTSLPTATQLVVGILKLEETDQAVTGEQAKELLPLWQVYQSLTGSSAAAQAEIDGLVEQTQETMTDGQMQAISKMSLTQQDVFAAMQEQGGDFIQNRQSSSSSTQSGGFTPPDGGGGMPGGAPLDGGGEMAGGAPPDGGMAGMEGTGPVASAGQSQEAEAGAGTVRSTAVPAPLIQALIQALEQRTDS